MDPRADDRRALTAEPSCGSCGTKLPPKSKFCNECGTPVAEVAQSAEYKQVTVLFADVVHSMSIAAAVGPERLREIMADLADRCAAVVKRYGGTVDKFTGDGIMAVFGAPVALEDHAVRACLAALAIQQEAEGVAHAVKTSDGVDLRLRVGLNSGQVIAGEIGSGAWGYTTIGEQVGMAQRMESIAPPGGVTLSESTARLVQSAASLSEPEMAHIKGTEEPVRAQRLLGVSPQHELAGSAQTALVGRDLEVATIAGLMDRSASGRGCVVCVAGPAGIGKTRLVGEAVRLANSRDIPVFSTFCESHATDIPFNAVARLLRVAIGVSGMDDESARAQVRSAFADADSDDLLLLYDMLGIRDADAAMPSIEPDARRRRLTALVNSMSLASTMPALYIIEDAHWIDEASESMLADFLTVMPQTHFTTLITYRPEYRGSLAYVSGAQTISLAPLVDSEATSLLDELVGSDKSVAAIKSVISARVAGNPFFAQEIVRDLAERCVLWGDRGEYTCRTDVSDVHVPDTLQAAIAARIDRLGAEAKKTLNAASVIGSRFSANVLKDLGIEPAVEDLVRAELVDQVRFTPYAEYAFHNPLVRTVAYESQLKSDRAQLHRRVADTIEHQDQNAALLAQHLEAAGDLHAAFEWHMRAGAWFNFRDFAAALTSWRRALQVADRLPEDDPQRTSMRIAPRTLLVGNAWRVAGARLDEGFDELRDLCTAAGDQRSLAIGMAGLITAMNVSGHDSREASHIATELVELLESIGDPTLTVATCYAPLIAKYWTGELVEVLRFAQLVIDLAEGDATKGALVGGSPLAMAIVMRGVARYCLGRADWKDDIRDALAMADHVGELTGRVGIRWYVLLEPIVSGVLVSDANAVRDAAEMLTTTEQTGDDYLLLLARQALGIHLINQRGAEREAGLQLLADLREATAGEQFPSPGFVPLFDIHIASEHARLGETEDAIERCRAAIDVLASIGAVAWYAPATDVLVTALLRRGCDSDLREARAAIDRLAAVPVDPGFVLHEVWLLRMRALLAHAHGDENSYRNYRDRYRAMASSLGFEGHMKWAEEMP
ncbi:MAG: adenylate/guanylate cyclase domain-containing protein [Candidatus Sericytochromatia bacterium]